MYLNLRKKYIFKIISAYLAFVFLFTQAIPQKAFASRSKSGGGKLAEFSWGSFAMSAGMSVGSTVFGGAINSALKGAWNSITGGSNSLTSASQATGSLAELQRLGLVMPQFGPLSTSSSLTQMGSPLFNLPQISPITTALSAAKSASPGFLSSMGNYFSSLSSLKNVASIAVSGFTTFTAVSQSGRAVAMAGAYYDWKPSSVFLVSNVVSGAVGGFLNPGIAMGDTMPKIPAGDIIAQTAFETSGYNMAKGAFVGGLTGLASGGAIVAIDGKSINQGKQPGTLAQIGGLWAGVAAGNFSRALVNPATWHEKSLGVFERETKTARLTPTLDKINRAIDDRPSVFIDKSKIIEIDKFYKLESTSSPGRLDRNPFDAGKLKEWADTSKHPNIEFRGDKVLFEVVDTNAHIGASQIGNRLLEATFIKTADMWPQLATRSASIAVSNALRENHNGLASFMSSAVEGIATPLFSGLAETFALKPGLYVGENRVHKGLEYIDNMKQELIRHAKDEKQKNEILKAESLDLAFKKAGKDRFFLFSHNVITGNDIKFGLVEGAISGGVSFLTSKLAEKNDPLVAAAVSYGAAMFSGAIRGAIWNLAWESDKKDEWRDSEGELRFIDKDVKGRELKPDLKTSIFASLSQANVDFLNRAFSFGIPRIKPERINSLVMGDYFRQLNGYAMSGARPDWLTSGLNFSMIDGASLAITNNIMGSLAAVKPVAGAFNIERQRLVFTNFPVLPVTIQTRVSYFAPFPDVYYRVRSKIGKSVLEGRGR